MGEEFEFFELDQGLNAVPSSSGQPLKWVFSAGLVESLQEELHLGNLVSDFDVLLLHESECQEREEDQLVSFEKSSDNPLADIVSDGSDEFFDSGLVLHQHLGDGFSKEDVEGVQRILVHVVHNIQGDDQEVEHSTFGGYSSVDFSLGVDFDFSLSGDFRLGFDVLRSLLGDVEFVDQFFVLQNGRGISFGKGL